MKEKEFDKKRVLLIKKLKELHEQKDPIYYGWPDLLAVKRKQGESIESLKKRQQEAIKDCVENYLHIKKSGEKIKIVAIKPMVEFIADLFYGHEKKAILWKPRGGGGSLSAAILILLCMLYKKMSFIDLAGAMDQALVVYNYTKEFWDGHPTMKKNLLVDALMSRTLLKTGAELSCIPTSDKQVRSKHRPGLVADESCQENENFGKIIAAAMSGVISEAEGDYLILLLSTFHIAFGFFQEYWDLGADRGFKRYKWTIFDCMKKCTLPIDCKKCELNEPETIISSDGRTKETRWPECNGRARNSDGWMSFKQVREAKTMHRGGEMWLVEFCCNRPRTAGPIYDPEFVDLCFTEEADLAEKSILSIGIDFGMATQSVCITSLKGEDGVVIPDIKYFEKGEDAQDIIKYLKSQEMKYKQKAAIFPDSAADFAIAEIQNAGFNVNPVVFSKWKEIGISNVANFIHRQKLKIISSAQALKLKAQLKKYHRDEKGRIVKKDDHGPDALMCSLLAFDFLEMFEDELRLDTEVELRDDEENFGVMMF